MEPAHIGGFGSWNLEDQMGRIPHNEGLIFTIKMVLFILALEDTIRKRPNICLRLITPSLFHVTTWYTCLWKGPDETSTTPLRSWRLVRGKRIYSYFS